MSEIFTPLITIARKEISDALRDRFIVIITLFLTIAALTALVTGAIALATEVASYNDARTALLALGKSASTIASPSFYPLHLLRGAIEQIEIIGSVLGGIIGYRSVSNERGRQTLALIMTRPLKYWQFLAGKFLGGGILLSLGLAAVFVLETLLLHFVSGVGLSIEDLLRIFIVWNAASIYTTAFFLIGCISALWMKYLPNALLLNFALWLLIVLIAPQIGDTLDPDNQVAGGVFKQLQISKEEENRIKAEYSTFETIRNGIESVSVTKHFERLSFAVLGIKQVYAGKPLKQILMDRSGDVLWILLFTSGLGVLLFSRQLSSHKLNMEI